MNENTLNSLGYPQIQKNVADCALSYLGKRYARELKPMVDAHLIQIRLEETAEAAALIRFGASIPSLHWMEWRPLWICSAPVIYSVNATSVISLNSCGAAHNS